MTARSRWRPYPSPVVSPLRILRLSWDFVFEVAKRWYYGGIGDLAAGVTFWILLTLPAAILAMVSALGQISAIVGQNLSDNVEDNIIEFVGRVLSSDNTVINDSVSQLFSQNTGTLLTFSIAISFWTISRGFAGMIRALDSVYEVENGRPWYTTRVVALILGLGSLLVSVPIVLLEIYIWGRLDGGVEGPLRWLSAIAILVLWASMIFHFGPSIRTKWRWDLPGSIVAATFWWALTEGFRYYVGITQGRNEVLTAVGASLLALTWVWLAAQVLLIGAAVNTELGARLGLDRRRSEWKVADVFTTGQMKKVVVPDDDPVPARKSG